MNLDRSQEHINPTTIEPKSSTRRTQNRHIAIIGASAGGLPALEKILPEINPDFSMPIVIILHQSKESGSQLIEILKRFIKRPVIEVVNGTEICPNNIYCIPPQQPIIIKNGKFSLAEQVRGLVNCFQIDLLMSTAAEDLGSSAIGILLSGTGTDGTFGLECIKKAGGLTISQSPDEAKFSEMPQNAINMNAANWVLTSNQIFPKVESYDQQLRTIDRYELHNFDQETISYIFDLLQQIDGVDFNKYLPSVIYPRITQRMALHNIELINKYVDLIKRNKEEVHNLHSIIIGGINCFFQDQIDYMKILNTSLSNLIESVKNRPIRIWVPSTGTGEEAYSIAMVIEDLMSKTGKNIEYRIFATDVDRQALKYAIQGKYFISQCHLIPQTFIEQFFDYKVNHYEVKYSVRSKIIFSKHNLIHDIPLSKIDLISCRKILKFFTSETNNRTISNFHFALNKGGYLFLGKEVHNYNNRVKFEVINQQSQVFQKKDESKNPDEKVVSIKKKVIDSFSSSYSSSPSKLSEHQYIIEKAAKKIFDERIPASLLISHRFEVITDYRSIDSSLAKSMFPININSNIIVDHIKNSIREMEKEDIDNLERYCKISTTKEPEIDVKLVVYKIEAVNPSNHPYFLISITKVNEVNKIKPRLKTFQDKSIVDKISESFVANNYNLDKILAEIKETNLKLNMKNEQLSYSNQALKNSNNELSALNEDLLDIKEKYQNKIDSVKKEMREIKHNITIAGIAVLILDQNLNISYFTNAVKEFIPIAKKDIGNSISKFTNKIGNIDLDSLTQKVIENRENISLFTENENNKTIKVKISHYNCLIDHNKDRCQNGFIIYFS